MKDIGTTVRRNSKQGGGVYTIIGHVNCPRESCNEVIEEREQQEPSKAQRENGYYWSTWSICPHCGLYKHWGKKIFVI